MAKHAEEGFTLIEVMLVAAIIGLLAAIALPKFGSMIRKAQEAALKGDLGALRSALTLYYADNEGIYPYQWEDPGLVLTRKYIESVPRQRVPYYPGETARGETILFMPNDDIGHWGACGLPYALPWAYNGVRGRIYVNCDHTDFRGNVWSLE